MNDIFSATAIAFVLFARFFVLTGLAVYFITMKIFSN